MQRRDAAAEHGRRSRRRCAATCTRCARLADALAPWFDVGEPVRGAYLHRWDLDPGLRDAEEALIAAGRLPATGARLVAVRDY